MTAPERVPSEVEVLAYAAIEREAKRRKELGKALIGQRYPDGRSEKIRSPLGDRMGSVYRTDPEPAWVVTDRDVLHEHLRTFNNATETVYEIADEAAAVEVLREHAPHLLVEITRVRPEWERYAVEQSRETGEPAAPGIANVKPAGTLTVTPAKDAFDVVGRLVQRGLLAWDGQLVAPAAVEREAS